jgi:hypothetical protein
VTAAGPGYSRLLGAEVETIGGRTVEEAVAALEPLIARDNDQQVRRAIPRFLRQTAILHIYAPPTFEAFRRNDDPALDAILALREHLPGC